MLGLKQPVLGIAAAILVMAISLGFVSFFDFPTFGSWVAYLMICIIPMQIMIGVIVGNESSGVCRKTKATGERNSARGAHGRCGRDRCAGVSRNCRWQSDAARTGSIARHHRFGGRHILGGDHVRRMAFQSAHQE